MTPAPTAFIIFGRAVAYFVIWLVLAFLLNRWSVAADRPGASDHRHLRKLSAVGLMLYGLGGSDSTAPEFFEERDRNAP